MRTMICICGGRLIGVDDEELFRLARAHVDDVHPDDELHDEEVLGIVADRARDASEVLHHLSAGR